MKSKLKIILWFFLLTQLFMKTLHADILFFKDNCGDNYIKNLAKFYYLTNKPQDLFSFMENFSWDAEGNNTTSTETQTAAQQFIKANKLDNSIVIERVNSWIKANRMFVYTSLSRYSKTRTCKLYIQIYGKIKERDFKFLSTELLDYVNPPFIHASLNSSGGNVNAAIKIGKLIRKHYGIVEVGNNTFSSKFDNRVYPSLKKEVVCYSACVLIYAAGIAKNIGLNVYGNWHPIGVHQHYFDKEAIKRISVEEGIKQYKKTNKLITDYFNEIDVSIELLNLSKSVNFDKIRHLNEKELQLYLPFAVAEYTSIIPIKIKQSRNISIKLITKMGGNAFKKLGANASLLDIIKEVDKNIIENFESFRWANGPGYYIERGIRTQNTSY